MNKPEAALDLMSLDAGALAVWGRERGLSLFESGRGLGLRMDTPAAEFRAEPLQSAEQWVAQAYSLFSPDWPIFASEPEALMWLSFWDIWSPEIGAIGMRMLRGAVGHEALDGGVGIILPLPRQRMALVEAFAIVGMFGFEAYVIAGSGRLLVYQSHDGPTVVAGKEARDVAAFADLASTMRSSPNL